MNYQNNKKSLVAICVLATIASLLVYYQAIFYPLSQFDSWKYILQNQCIQTISLDNLICILTKPYFGNWQPTTLLSYMLEYLFFEDNAKIYHITNIVIHAINSVVVFFVCLQMIKYKFPKKAYLEKSSIYCCLPIMLIFLVHPQHVESVVWAAERKGLLAFMFIGFTILINHKIKTADEYSIKNEVFAIGFYILAATSKPTAITIPFALVILDRFFYAKMAFMQNGIKSEFLTIARFLYYRKIYVCIAVFTAAVNYYSQSDSGALIPISQLNINQRFFGVLYAIFFYIEKFFSPTNLHLFYLRPSFVYDFNVYYLGIYILAFLSISTFTVYKSKKGDHSYLLVWSIYLVLSIPTIGILQAGGQVAADRYSYLTTFPFYIGLGFLYMKFFMVNKNILYLTSFFLLCALTVQCKNQIFIWQNDFTLWFNVQKKSEDGSNYRAELILGKLMYQQKNYSRSVEYYEQASSKAAFKLYSKSYFGLAEAYLKAGQSAKSITTYVEIINAAESSVATKIEAARHLRRIYVSLNDIKEIENIDHYLDSLPPR